MSLFNFEKCFFRISINNHKFTSICMLFRLKINCWICNMRLLLICNWGLNTQNDFMTGYGLRMFKNYISIVCFHNASSQTLKSRQNAIENNRPILIFFNSAFNMKGNSFLLKRKFTKNCIFTSLFHGNLHIKAAKKISSFVCVEIFVFIWILLNTLLRF